LRGAVTFALLTSHFNMAELGHFGVQLDGNKQFIVAIKWKGRAL
jgi:hypothetical protein